MPQVNIIGEIAGASGFEEASLFAKYEFLFDQERWRVLEGERSGRTWIAVRDQEDEVGVWGQPLDISFSTVSVRGWPKLKVEVYELDTYDRTDLAGYGFTYIPPQPGHHRLDVVISRPAGTATEEFNGSFLGGRAHYLQPSVITSPASRQGHHTISRGVVHLDLHVVVKDFVPQVRMCSLPPSEGSGIVSNNGKPKKHTLV